MTITVTVRSNRLNVLAALIEGRARLAVDNAATEIADLAGQLSPRDTGSLAASWYTNNGEMSTYPQRSAAARTLNRDANILPEVSPEFSMSLFGGGSGYSVVVGSAVEHALYQELGTRNMAARPSLIPSTEGNREGFIADMSNVANV